LNDVRVAKPLRDSIRFEFDLAGKPFDYSGLAYARFAYEHRRVGPLAVTEDFDHLSNLFVATDYRRQLVLPGQFVEANAEMFQVRREFVTTAVTFLFLFVAADAGLNLLHNHLAVCAEPFKEFHRITVSILEERDEEVCRFYKFTITFV